jgi:hypothetical protein
MANDLDLTSIFQSVTEKLSENKESLNETDTYNHDHGDHMVQIFGLIQNAVAEKKDKPVSEQLDYASKVVEKEAHSGSGEFYAKSLSSAAQKFTGTKLDAGNIGMLVQSLLGAEKPPKPDPEPEPKKGLFGSLLSGLLGKKDTKEQNQGLDVNDLMQAGLAFYQSKQEGGNTTQALMDALVSSSPLGQSAPRTQSGTLIASTIMNVVGSLGKNK